MKSSCDLVNLHRNPLASCKMQAVSMQDGNASGLLCNAGRAETLGLLSPGQQPLQLRIAHGQRGPALQQERQIPFHVEIVRPDHLHHRVNPRAGLCAGRRIAEQPVPAPHAERADGVFRSVVGQAAASVFQIGFQIRPAVFCVCIGLAESALWVRILQALQPFPKCLQNGRRLFQAVRMPLFRCVGVFSAILLNCKQLVAVDYALHRRMRIVHLLSLRNGVMKVPTNMRPAAGAHNPG